jgi:signal transduction histidine kinase
VISLNIASLQMMHLTGKYSKQELSEIIENSNETIEYMSKTIQDFTEFLKPSEIREKLKIGTIFYQLMSLVKSDIQQYEIDFTINFKLDKDLIIELNSSKFTQVIINIIKNAIDEFKSKHIQNPTISIDIELLNNVYIISIQDNAGGIPPQILDTIFEPYVSTKGKNGTGLGMYMSKLLVESHLGGTIDVINQNGGALFSLQLPIKGN